MDHEMMKEKEAMVSDAAAERERRQKRAKWLFICWRDLIDYVEEDELQLYRFLCREKTCLALVGNSQEDHCVYSAWVAFEMVRYYDREIDALEEMRRYLATKADEMIDPANWKTPVADTIFGFFGRSTTTHIDHLVEAAYYRDALEVVTEILKLRKGLKTCDETQE